MQRATDSPLHLMDKKQQFLKFVSECVGRTLLQPGSQVLVVQVVQRDGGQQLRLRQVARQHRRVEAALHPEQGAHRRRKRRQFAAACHLDR